MKIEMRAISSHRFSVLADGRSFDAAVCRNDSKHEILMNGNLWKVAVETPTEVGARRLLKPANSGATGVEVRSPMPGMVVRCEVRNGSKIKAGDGLLILEAMKMENEIKATVSGIVKKVMVIDKQVVDKGELLLIIG
jgi:pyruvate carboxylase subunit B